MNNFKEWIQDVPKKNLFIFDFDNTLIPTSDKPDNWQGRDWWGNSDSLTPSHYNGETNPAVIMAMKAAQQDPNAKVIMMTGRRGIVSHHVRSILRQNGLYGKRMISPSNQDANSNFNDLIKNGKDEVHPKEKNGHEEYYVGDLITEPDYPTTSKGKKDGSTFAHKSYVLNKAISENGGKFEAIEMWDDRVDHIEMFKVLGHNLLQKGACERFIIHQVIDGKIVDQIVH